MKVTKVDEALITFFLKPTESTLPAVQQAWDEAVDARFGISYIHNHLDVALRKAGHRKGPSRAIVSHFVGAVQANLVPRPSLSTCVAELEPVAAVIEPPFETLTPESFRHTAIPLSTPLQLLPIVPRDALRDVFEQLVAEEEAALLEGIRAKASAAARARLLVLLEELEPSHG